MAPSEITDDYYALLEVPQTATLEIIRKSYRRLAVALWWTYFTSPVYNRAKETEEKKQQREIERLQRLASKSIEINESIQKEARLQSLKSALQDVNDKISAEKKKKEDDVQAHATKMQEQLRKVQEARRRSEEQQERERQAKWEAAQAELRREEAVRAAKARDAREAKEA